MYEQFPIRAVVVPAAARMGVDLTDRQIELLDRLSAELLSWNDRVNLTSIINPRDVAIRHILDSLTVVPLLRSLTLGHSSSDESSGGSASVDESPPPWRGRVRERGNPAQLTLVDVGAGGGFPGLPIAITMPDAEVTLVDATAKKVSFLEHVVEKLNLPNARAIHSTAEELGQDPGQRGTYDVGVVRAVGSVATLIELLVPLLCVDGRAILMKKRSAVEEEIAAAAPALEALSASVERIVEIDGGELLPDRAVAVVRKMAETPERFPRRPGVPRRRPLDTARS